MASFDDNYQYPSIFLILMLIRATVITTPLGFQNLNNIEKSKGIVVVVVKWRQRANLLLASCRPYNLSFREKSISNRYRHINVKYLWSHHESRTCTSSLSKDYLFCLGCVPLGWSGSGSVIQDHSDRGSSKDLGTDESSWLVTDSSVPLMHLDLSDLGSLIQITPKERTLVRRSQVKVAKSNLTKPKRKVALGASQPLSRTRKKKKN